MRRSTFTLYGAREKTRTEEAGRSVGSFAMAACRSAAEKCVAFERSVGGGGAGACAATPAAVASSSVATANVRIRVMRTLYPSRSRARDAGLGLPFRPEAVMTRRLPVLV